jgi:deoxycytidylate deaminase
MTGEQKKYEFYVEKIVKAGGQKGVERIRPTDPQAKAVIDNHKKCAICPTLYTDKPDIFEIHHIDGRSDNTITKNLALICSNCHKQVHAEANRILKDAKKGDPYPIRLFFHPSIYSKTKPENPNKKTKLIPCAYCEGSGKENPFLGTVCRVCKGKGKNEINTSAEDCAYCKGTGKENPFLGAVCRVCKGRGYN